MRIVINWVNYIIGELIKISVIKYFVNRLRCLVVKKFLLVLMICVYVYDIRKGMGWVLKYIFG